jgi:hypothetical protein
MSSTLTTVHTQSRLSGMRARGYWSTCSPRGDTFVWSSIGLRLVNSGDKYRFQLQLTVWRRLPTACMLFQLTNYVSPTWEVAHNIKTKNGLCFSPRHRTFLLVP